MSLFRSLNDIGGSAPASLGSQWKSPVGGRTSKGGAHLAPETAKPSPGYTPKHLAPKPSGGGGKGRTLLGMVDFALDAKLDSMNVANPLIGEPFRRFQHNASPFSDRQPFSFSNRRHAVYDSSTDNKINQGLLPEPPPHKNTSG